MKILLTGGLGQVGSYAGERLSENNEVTIIDNFSNSLNNIKFSSNIKIIKGDIRNQKIVNDLVGKADTIIHTAAQTSVNKSIEDPTYDADNNVNGTLNLLEAARKSDIKRFIYISLAAVYGDPITLPINEEHPTNPLSPYGLSKLTGEKYMRLYYNLYELPTVCLRPFNIFSPRQNPIIFGDGNQTRDFVFVKDVVKANILAAEGEESGVFNVGSGASITVAELTGTIIDLLGKDMKPVHEAPREGDIKHSFSDIKGAKAFGYESGYSLKEGLKETIGWFKMSATASA